MFRFLTAGESHGQKLTIIVEGIPANLPVTQEEINTDLARRQKGYGRGGRMRIETDKAHITGGVRLGKTMGTPIAMDIMNKDWENWTVPMSVAPFEDPDDETLAKIKDKSISQLRPGHADMAGAIKFNQKDIRNTLERSSARETASRVAVGAIARKFLREFGIEIYSHIIAIGEAKGKSILDNNDFKWEKEYIKSYFDRVEASEVRADNEALEKEMITHIEESRKKGVTLGGVFEVVVTGLPIGLGSYSQWDRRLGGRIGQAVMSINAVKSCEIGSGIASAYLTGDKVHDELFYDQSKHEFYRKTNKAGGLEGGMTNGSPLIVKGYMKPIPTMIKPLQSVDIVSKEPYPAHFERSDVCATPAAGIVGEAMLAIVLAEAMLDKFGGDSISETLANYRNYQDYVRNV